MGWGQVSISSIEFISCLVEPGTADMVPPTLLKLLSLGRLVVVFLENSDRSIHMFGDNLGRNATVELSRDRPRPDLVQRSRRRALTRRRLREVVAGVWVVPVRAVGVKTGHRPEVHPRPDSVLHRSTD